MNKTSYSKLQISFFYLLYLNYIFITILGMFSVSRLSWLIEKVRTFIIHALLLPLHPGWSYAGITADCANSVIRWYASVNSIHFCMHFISLPFSLSWHTRTTICITKNNICTFMRKIRKTILWRVTPSEFCNCPRTILFYFIGLIVYLDAHRQTLCITETIFVFYETNENHCALTRHKIRL